MRGEEQNAVDFNQADSKDEKKTVAVSCAVLGAAGRSRLVAGSCRSLPARVLYRRPEAERMRPRWKGKWNHDRWGWELGVDAS